MTQKYLVALARGLATSRPSADGPMMDQWLEDVDMIANVCQANNPKFKRAMFIVACKTW